MPVNIPDVSTIEKLHFQQLQNNMHVLPNSAPIFKLHHIENPMNVVCGGSANEPETSSESLVCEQNNCASPEDTVNEANPTKNSAPSCNNNNNDSSNSAASEKSLEVCDNNERTRPAVVILSGDASKEVSGITFGFDINEQLLCGDVCSDFVARYFVPESINANYYNHEKLVNYIGGGKFPPQKKKSIKNKNR